MFSFSKKKKTPDESSTAEPASNSDATTSLLPPMQPELLNNRSSSIAQSKAGSLARPPMEAPYNLSSGAPSAFAYGGNSGEDQKYESPDDYKEDKGLSSSTMQTLARLSQASEEPSSPGMPEFRRSFGIINDGYMLSFEIAIEEQSIEEFGLNEQEAFCMAVAHCLGLTKAQVGVETARAGSVVATMKVAGLPDSDAASAVAAKIANGLTDQLEGFGLGPCAIVSKISGEAPQQQEPQQQQNQNQNQASSSLQTPLQALNVAALSHAPPPPPPAPAPALMPPRPSIELVERPISLERTLPPSLRLPLPAPSLPNPARGSAPFVSERSTSAVVNNQSLMSDEAPAEMTGYAEKQAPSPQMQHLQQQHQHSPQRQAVNVSTRGAAIVPVEAAIETADTAVQTETSNTDDDAVPSQRDSKWQAWWETLPVDAQFEEVTIIARFVTNILQYVNDLSNVFPV